MYMWGTCIKFIIFVQSTSLWYICKYWIKRDFATFIYIYMSSCWKINLSIYFRQRHLCHWRHYLFQSFGPSRVKSGCINWLLLRSFGFFRIWSPQFILNTRLLGHSTVSRSTLYSWLIPLWPFDIGMGFLRGCILSIHTAWSVLTWKLAEKKTSYSNFGQM